MAPFDFSKEAEETDKELSEELDKLNGLSDEKISELLPARTDQDQLKDLIDAVNNETDKNKKKAVLLDRLAVVTPAVKAVVKGIIKIAV